MSLAAPPTTRSAGLAGEPRRVAAGRRGYTLVELLIAAGVATISLYASLQMATYTLRGNTDLRDSQAALSLAQHMISTMQAEGWLWTKTEDLAQRLYLRHAPLPPTIGQMSEWKIANTNEFAKDMRVGEIGFDKLWDMGALQEVQGTMGARYCLHYRLAWVAEDMMRAEVRVSWARPHLPVDALNACPLDLIDNVASVHSVALAGTVQRNASVP